MSANSVVGKSMKRIDSLDKVLGRAKYGADIHLPGMLKAKILHSPYAHARIARIDISGAEMVAGVKAVVTAQDTGEVKIGRFIRDRTILAQEKVRYIGEPVAAIAAINEETATEALKHIDIEYEELPAVFDRVEAMNSKAPIVHEAVSTYLSPIARCSRGNILHEAHIQQGIIAEAWAQADIIHEDEYTTQAVHQGFIEPHAVVSYVDSSGKVTLWSSTKALFDMRRYVSEAVGLPMSRIQVKGTTVGGDFGGKGSAYLEPICVALALKAKLPVSLSLTREEEFVCTFLRDRATLRLKLAAKRDGTLLGLQSTLILDAGAYCDNYIGLLSRFLTVNGPYRIPIVDLACYYVYTNNHPTGHVRAPIAIAQQTFAIESHMDALARKLNIDPLEIRLRNALKDGDRLPGGGVLCNVGLTKTTEAAAEYLQKNKGPAERDRGWGIACGLYGAHLFHELPFVSNPCIRVNEDGTVILLTGVAESGGGQHTILAQIVAEVLKVPYESVTVVSGDTDIVPPEWSTSAEETTHRSGMMVKMAAEDVREQLLQLASERLGVEVGALELVDGRAVVKDSPSKGIFIAQLARWALNSPHGAIQGTGSVLRRNKMALLAEEMNIIDAPSFSTHVAEVEVDPETGKIKVLSYFVAHDVGFAINPNNVEGQIQGASVFGLGFAMSEEVIVDRGQVVNPTMADYKQPTAADIPVRFETRLIEIPSGHGPFGAKGCGESPVPPVAPAIANAVFDATGVRITNLPITPEKVLKALKRKAATETD